MSDNLFHALEIIESRDPDGQPERPTREAYAAHKAWALDRFGRDIWNLYLAGGYAPPQGDG